MTETSLDLTSLIQYGALGVIVVLFVFGWIVPKKTLEDRDRANAALAEENSRLRKAMEEQVIPALVRATDLLDKMSRRQR